MGSKERKVVDQARRDRQKRVPAQVEPLRNTLTVVDGPTNKKSEVSVLQVRVVQMLARGYTIPEVARKYVEYLVPQEMSRDKKLKRARYKVRSWMMSHKMRDLLWEETMIGLDLDSPQIVRGIARKAKAGRVDAARLSLEMTGRHAPQAEIQPATINIAFGDIPRPRRAITDGHDVVDVDPDEIVEVDDD